MKDGKKVKGKKTGSPENLKYHVDHYMGKL